MDELMAETSSFRRRVRRRPEAGVPGKLVGSRAAVGVGLLVVVLLAGCSASGGSGAATTTTSGQQNAAAVLREFVRCARANGMPNLPDLRLDSNGQVSVPPGTPEVPKSVERACKSILERLPASASGDQGRPPADMQALLGFARCMREHGMADFPDPQADGRFPLPQSLRGGKTPSFLRANQACRQLNPNQKGRLEFNG
jgi:ubiquitin